MTQPPPALPPPPSSLVPTITPASLSSLAIYNPSLGPTDETVAEQIVFYTSRTGSSEDDENERLRHIGLVQGVVGFACDFSNSDGCTWVDTQKARIVILETEEKGWWIVAKVELTYLHNPTTQPAKSEWSSREVSPPQLIFAQLRRAYMQYRFRYGSFEDGLAKFGRTTFCKKLNKYWNRWAWNRWEAMLFRNPTLEFLADRVVKSAGSARGVEIGEQDRKFLEGWIKKQKARGMVDVVISRFGKEPSGRGVEDGQQRKESQDSTGYWFWGKRTKDAETTEYKKQAQDEEVPVVMPDDGCVFPGIGELTTRSVIDLANYLAELYETGEGSTTLTRTSSQRRQPRRKRRGPKSSRASQLGVEVNSNRGEVVTAPEVSPPKGESSPQQPATPSTHPSDTSTIPVDQPVNEETPPLAPMENVDPLPQDIPQLNSTLPETIFAPPNASKVMNILTFGWSNSRTHSPAPSISSSKSIEPLKPEHTPPQKPISTLGRFIIGFQGDLDTEDIEADIDASSGRITSRTVWVSPQSSPDVIREYRLVVYYNPPLYFAFLLQPTSPHLTATSFYREIHHQLSPLVPRVLSPPTSVTNQLSLANCYTVLYIPSSSTLHCTIPPIPDPGTQFNLETWTRAEALHVNTIVLAMLTDTSAHKNNTGQKSVRSNRNWWIHWLRTDEGEVLLVKRPGKGAALKHYGGKGNRAWSDKDGEEGNTGNAGLGEELDDDVTSVLTRLLRGI
ncbi:hypothetical protein EX30DRAFT_10677 [Ascodesmis nigricans]|uniref:CCZ1/INTU/HSP4 first Longin domain-containing protein n=1 Tax=Ascodesmis nigricans TaxID=341454 RepID=A0A4S2N6A4_9PEZI|nr:hypothetical protein EX30DRAFT_10677 [Ascodesmis nigricans]